jgi:lipoprotein NlpD
MMLKVSGTKTSQCLVLAALILLVAGCAPSRVPAPVENRTVSKTKPATKEGASEIRAGSSQPVPAGFYRVRKGDTLIGISLDHGVSWRDLADWNGLQNPNLIEVDQLIRINPPGSEARVASVSPRPAPMTPSAPSPATTEVRPINPSQPRSQVQATPSSAQQTASVSSSTGSPALSWPTNGRVITQFADPGYKGVAFSGQEGDPVLAAGDGRVVYSGSGLRGYGNLVIVKHEGDFLTAYAHNRKILVNEGQAVKRGQQIAELGSTDSDIPKLHFEVRLSGKPVDPMKYLAQR